MNLTKEDMKKSIKVYKVLLFSMSLLFYVLLAVVSYAITAYSLWTPILLMLAFGFCVSAVVKLTHAIWKDKDFFWEAYKSSRRKELTEQGHSLLDSERLIRDEKNLFYTCFDKDK